MVTLLLPSTTAFAVPATRNDPRHTTEKGPLAVVEVCAVTVQRKLVQPCNRDAVGTAAMRLAPAGVDVWPSDDQVPTSGFGAGVGSVAAGVTGEGASALEPPFRDSQPAENTSAATPTTARERKTHFMETVLLLSSVESPGRRAAGQTGLS
jgi:hypothetical protein